MLLNHLPISFSSRSFRGWRRAWTSREDFEQLRLKLAQTHFVLRHGDELLVFPFAEGAATEGTPTEFSVDEDHSVANALARHALLRTFFDRNRQLSGVRPVRFVVRKNLIEGEAASLFAVYPEYSFDIRILAHEAGEFSSGILVNFHARQLVLPSASDLVRRRVDITGMYLLGEGERESLYVPPMFSRKLLGRVAEVRGDEAFLVDARQDCVPLEKAHIEPSRHQFERVGRALLRGGYDGFNRRLQAKIFSVSAAQNQLKRIGELSESFADLQGDLPCCVGLTVRLSGGLTQVNPGIGVGQSRKLPNPSYSLRPGGSITVRWPVDPEVAKNGPYDSDGFPKKRPRVALVFPANHRGHIEAFAAQLRDGIQGSAFSMGMVRKFRLQGLDFELAPVPVQSGPERAQAYRRAAIEVSGREVDAAVVVVTRDDRTLHGADNPYYVAKAALMSQGVPVQAVTLETILEPGVAYSLNNISLALYAKLGGIPWTLSVQQRLVHEIVVGIGSARVGGDRLSERERLIGITTVFSADGNYLLGNATTDAPSDQYRAVLLESLRSNLSELQRRFGWRKGDKLRIIFHQSFKRYRDVEADAVADLVAELSDFEVEYAFVQVSSDHDWRIFDPEIEGIQKGVGLKGACVPERGQVVPLGPRAALVTLTGPKQLKTAFQGCPSPMLVSIHPRSTFDSLDYIAKQVHDLTFMSWRTFMPSTEPVSIKYPNLVVELLANLRQIPNFNPDILVTKLRESRWFL